MTRSIFFFSVLIFLTVPGYSQGSICKEFSHEDFGGCSSRSISTCPREFSSALNTALLFYPELKDVSIKFRYADIRTTMETRPVLLSTIFGKRSYLIFIDTITNGEGVLLKDVPFNAQVGIIGHELSHISDYEKRNLFQMVKLGLHYKLHPSFASYEKSIDQLTVKKGLGWQILCWSDFIINHSNASENHKAFKRRYYLSPSEIEYLIAENVQYHSETN